jgi:hypothetical protein
VPSLGPESSATIVTQLSASTKEEYHEKIEKFDTLKVKIT